MTVLIYVDTSKEVGDRDYLKVFANELASFCRETPVFVWRHAISPMKPE
jgi:hypothetical protein